MDSITFDIAKSDVIARNTRQYFTSPGTFTAWAVYVVLIGGLLVYLRDPAAPIDWDILAFSSMLGATASIVLTYVGLMALHLRRLKRTRGVLGTHSFTFCEDGLVEETSANQTLMKWGALTSVRRNSERILLEVQPNRGHYLPRRAFRSNEHYDSFWQKVQRLAATDA